jgi:hypothetical protein
VVLEHVRRAGRVFAEPGREGAVSEVVIPGRVKDANPESRDSGFALKRAPE